VLPDGYPRPLVHSDTSVPHVIGFVAAPAECQGYSASRLRLLSISFSYS